MADFSYPGVSSFSEVSVGAYMENRPASGLNLTPKRRAVTALNSPASANGKITPCRDITPFRRDSQDTIPIYFRGSANVQEVLPPPTLFPASNEHLCEEKWFNAEIQHRKLVSGLWTGAATFLILLGAFVAFHFSFWSPIRSLTSLLQAFFSPKLHALAFIAACVYGIVGFFLACLMARVDQQKRAALSRLETWISFCINLSFFIVVFSIGLEMFFDKSLLTNANVFNFLFCVGTALCAAVNVLSHDYQLLFGGLKLKSVNKNTPGSLIITNISLSAEQSLRQGVKVIACTAIASIFLVPIFFGFSGWLFLFNLSGHYALVTSFTAQILIGHVLHRIIRQKVLQPMQFPFPPPYTVTHPSAEQRRNMSDMLLSTDPLLKLFALFDLRFIAWFDINRRADAYALSQPAGNPKNWKSICGPTLDILNLIKSKVDQSRNKAAGIDDSIVEDSDEEEYLNRNMLMMPPSARGQLFSARTRNRHQTALKPAKKTVQFSNPAVPDKIARWTLHTEETGLLSRLEAEMAVLAIEALDMFVISSFGDDRYGVVQKDLAPIVRAFIGLHSSIDRYLRLKGFSQSASGNEALMRGVEDVLVSAVTRIGEKFSTFIRSIGLTNAEWRLFESIMSQSSINT